jgi:hypothetical protein
MSFRPSRSPKLPLPFSSLKAPFGARRRPAGSGPRTRIRDAMIVDERDVLRDVTWQP